MPGTAIKDPANFERDRSQLSIIRARSGDFGVGAIALPLNPASRLISPQVALTGL
ncbi:hypothetical protein BH720_017155 [Desertifilum tharense IPPAS B-1220]|uniref:Uncharacterized protein n=1 Tax=Desertifilum tharense IPPAS B-1220 TaxID=1781255 RepID=A0ACD5GPF7_9CYAN